MRWEYKAVRDTTYDALEYDLNGFGHEGWELVSVVVSDDRAMGEVFVAYMKRPDN